MRLAALPAAVDQDIPSPRRTTGTRDERRTKKELINEIASLREEVAELRRLERLWQQAHETGALPVEKPRHDIPGAKTLKGLLPICACCKNIRDDKGYWNRLETYIKEHSDADFTHGLCPDCIKKLYPVDILGKKT
jgi:hypothetical protein